LLSLNSSISIVLFLHVKFYNSELLQLPNHLIVAKTIRGSYNSDPMLQRVVILQQAINWIKELEVSLVYIQGVLDLKLLCRCKLSKKE